jgi:hypothetical protein
MTRPFVTFPCKPRDDPAPELHPLDIDADGGSIVDQCQMIHATGLGVVTEKRHGVAESGEVGGVGHENVSGSSPGYSTLNAIIILSH